MNTYRSRAAQRGQSMVEFYIVFVLFLALMGGIIEMTYLYRAKHMFNTATFEAARAGALTHALPEPMSQALARNMAPIYMRSQRSVEGVGKAIAQAETVRAALDAAGHAISLVSPSRASYDALKVEQKLRLETEPRDTAPTKRDVIPNDNLSWRPRTQVDIDGGRINVQDGNLLKIDTYWCHQLVVPVLDQLVAGIARSINKGTAEQVACDALSRNQRFYMLIRSKATIHMQSPVIEEAYASQIRTEAQQ